MKKKRIIPNVPPEERSKLHEGCDEKVMKFKKGDKVKLPFNETGTVVKVRKNLLWGHNYDVKIRKATLSITNEIADFKESQMELE